MASGEIAKLFATIGADISGLDKGLGDTKTKLSGMQTTMTGLQTVVTRAFVAMGAAAVGFGASIAKTGIEFLAMKEQAQVAFTTMLGSGEKAQAFLDDMADFAAKTPFEFPDLIRAGQRLLAMGFAATEIRPMLTAVGDAVAGLGGGAFEIDRVTTALGQMGAKGKTSAQEMMQLTEVGIPAWQILADKIGVSVPEAMKMVEKGAVDARTTIDAVIAGMETRFGGMMEAQSTTWNGLTSTLKDNFSFISASIMGPFFDMAKAGLIKLVAGVEAMKTAMDNGASVWLGFQHLLVNLLPKEIFEAWNFFRIKIELVSGVIGSVAKSIADAIGRFVTWKDVMIAVGVLMGGALLSAIGGVIAALWPVITTIAAVTAAVSLARWAWENDFAGIQTFTKNTLDKLSNWFFKESGIWKGSWEATGAYIADVVRKFFQYDIYNFIVGTWAEIKFQWWFRTTQIRDQTIAWVNELTQTIVNWKDRTLGYFTGLTTGIVNTVKDWTGPTLHNIDVWYTVTVANFKRWYDWVVRYVGDARDWIMEKWQGVLDWWNQRIQPWVNAGRDMVQGLWNGMKEKWNNLRDWFTGVWGQLTDRFKAFFGIHSPSTLFAGYGDDMMSGLANGIGDASSKVYDALGILQGGMTDQVSNTLGGLYANVGNTGTGLGIKPGQAAIAPFVKLEEAVGQSKAGDIFESLRTLASDANQAFRAYGVVEPSILQFTDKLANAAALNGQGGVGGLKTNIDNLVQQLNNTGVANNFGAGAKSGLLEFSDYLDILMQGGVYGTAPPTSPTSDTGGSNDQLLGRMVELLAIIVEQLRKNGALNHDDLGAVRAYLSNIGADYGGLVSNTAGLR